MATVSVYLNFNRNTEEAFLFYQSVFGGEFVGGISRMEGAPPAEGQPALADADKNLVMHVALPLMGDFVLMGTDAPESMGFSLIHGNNAYINLQPDTRAETERIFDALSVGGVVEMPLQEMFWGDYFASFKDKFGVCWMLACASKK
jgi:PhnB protein